jgi:hypothetical protein
MIDSDLMLTDGLDQPITTDNEWALARIEEIVNRAIEAKNAYLALDACKQLVQVSKMSGHTLAKGLSLIKSNWNKFGIEETFEDVAFMHLGLHPHTIDRYIKTHELLEDCNGIIPKDLLGEMKQRNIKELIPIANMVAQGYELEQLDWEHLVDAPDFTTIASIVRSIKGQEPRKSGIQIHLVRTGELIAFQAGTRYHIGVLNVDDTAPTVTKSIERIVNNTGILED